MNPRVEEYLKRRQQEKLVLDREQREELLIELGLCDKVYVEPEDAKFDNSSTHYTEWVDGKKLYYKKVPITVTEEEFEEILKTQKEKKKNRQTLLWKIAAWVFIIVGIYLLMANPLFLLLAALGVCLLGMSELIGLLGEIKDKL